MKHKLGKVFRFAMPFLKASLIKQILVGMILGFLVGEFWPEAAPGIGFLGEMFVSALKGVAPVLVFVLVISSIASNEKMDGAGGIRKIVGIYAVATLSAALVSVLASFLFPVEIDLQVQSQQVSAPGGILEVLRSLALNIVDNPFHAIVNANYIGILAWAIAVGVVLRSSAPETRIVLQDASRAIEAIVSLVIRFAPVGIFGLMAKTVATAGLEALLGYAQLLILLLGTMAFVALVINPLIVWYCTRENPYPMTLMTLRESGIPAFFTRSSAANIPVNMDICRRRNLPESIYSISIPVGSTVNMAGAAVTITIMTLSAAYSLGIAVDIPTALFLCVVASICAAGTSGVPGGSIMLIPLACGLFGISQDIAMQVLAIGMIIGVLQDSTETGLNSSSDVLFTMAACKMMDRRKIQARRAEQAMLKHLK